MNDLREKYAELTPIDDASYKLQMGDACVVNMEGYMATDAGEKGEKLPDAASGDRVEVILGEGRYMTGLVEGLVGAQVGETKTVSVTFPTVRAGIHSYNCRNDAVCYFYIARKAQSSNRLSTVFISPFSAGSS